MVAWSASLMLLTFSLSFSIGSCLSFCFLWALIALFVDQFIGFGAMITEFLFIWDGPMGAFQVPGATI